MTNIILGGGIAGLSAAYYLSKHCRNGIKLIEKTERVGGWIRTIKNNDGTSFELGPRTLRAYGEAGKNTIGLLHELELHNLVKAVSDNHPASENRFICIDDQLLALPKKGSEVLFKSKPPINKPIIYSLFKDWTTEKKSVTDDSIYDFVERRFGKHIAEYLVSPLVCGVVAGDAKEITVKLFMEKLFKCEQEYGTATIGFLKHTWKELRKDYREKKNKLPELESETDLHLRASVEKWNVLSFENGLETFPKSLAEYLEDEDNVDIVLNEKCDRIQLTENGVSLTMANGKSEETEHLYSALPSHVLAKLISDDHQYLKKELSAIPFVTVGVVNLQYEGNVLTHDGFGYLIPPNQKKPVLGVTFDTCVFPQDGKTVLTVMMGGRWFYQYFGSNPDKDTLLSIAKEHVKNTLHIEQEPENSLVSILKDCIPQYLVGHYERISNIRKYISDNKLPLTLIGNSYDGVGINDVILSVKKTIEARETSET